jgi:hypothetical protein
MQDIKTNSITQNLTAKSYKTRFMEPGLVNYPEKNQMVYISLENLPTIAQKFKGCKIITQHKEVSQEEAREEIVGYVNDIYMEDGWAWANFTVHAEEAIDLIDNKGYKPSSGYKSISTKQGGVKNAVVYDDEVIDIIKDDEVTHIALVENPRYNDAIILENSIDKNSIEENFINENSINNKIKNKIMNIFKFKSEKEGSKELTLENSLFEIDGEEMPVSEMVSYYKNAMAEKKAKEEEEKANKCKYANGDDKIDVDGEEMTISELANFYKKNKKKNEEMKEEDKKENEEKEEDKKENEDKEEDKKENEDMKEEDKKENEDKEEDKKENEKEEEEEKKGNTMKNSIGVEKGDDLNANGIKYENGISNPCKPKVASLAAMLERGQNMFSK